MNTQTSWLYVYRGDATVRTLRAAICNEFQLATERSRIFANGLDIAPDGSTKPLDRIVSSMDVRMWAVRATPKRSAAYYKEMRSQKTLKLAADIRTHIHTLPPGHLYNKKVCGLDLGKSAQVLVFRFLQVAQSRLGFPVGCPWVWHPGSGFARPLLRSCTGRSGDVQPCQLSLDYQGSK